LKKPQALIGLLAALGTAIGVMVAVIGLPYGRADFTAFAELYHGTVDTSGTFHLAVDTNTSTVATDPSATIFLPGPTTKTVAVTVGNSTSLSPNLGAWGFNLEHPDPGTSLAGQTPACDPSGLNCNPDFNEAFNTGGWACSPPPPTPDNPATIEVGQDAFIGCFNGALDGQVLPASPNHEILAFVYYNIPGTATAQTIPLTITEGSLYDESFGELMSCEPVITTAGACFDGELVLSDPPTPTNTVPAPPTDTPTPAPPTNTPAPTNTPTNTATPTDTATPLSASGIIKIPEGNGNNAQQLANGWKANLWICEAPAACAGPGEGSLRVVERALNVPAIPQADPLYNGLGAYEFSVEYDNFVIQSVNPCDIVFSAQASGNGVGFTLGRGPVDEVNASSPANADCNPDVNTNANGTCAMSIILENIVHFGCVTVGQNPAGPTGSFDLASLELIPHPDLNNDLFPGNNNGVLTIIKDNGCELVDTLGHPIPGSINGGLTKLCRDLAVTVRILEGDLDLNCVVNLTDAQAIASRYGAFFGGLLYSKWYDLEPQFHDLDIDIKDIQKVFGRQGSTCQNPIPNNQGPLDPFTPFKD
jgi:hypothetical protein